MGADEITCVVNDLLDHLDDTSIVDCPGIQLHIVFTGSEVSVFLPWAARPSAITPASAAFAPSASCSYATLARSSRASAFAAVGISPGSSTRNSRINIWRPA